MLHFSFSHNKQRIRLSSTPFKSTPSPPPYRASQPSLAPSHTHLCLSFRRNSSHAVSWLLLSFERYLIVMSQCHPIPQYFAKCTFFITCLYCMNVYNYCTMHCGRCKSASREMGALSTGHPIVSSITY